jgi:predicted permease
MNIIHLYIKLLLLVVLPLITGMAFSGHKYSKTVSSRLFALALYLFQTIIVVLAVWTAQLKNCSWILPIITLTGFTLSIFFALYCEKWLKHNNRQKGAFIFSICLSNNGYTLLGIVALIVFGDAGLAQATYAQFLIIPFLTLVCFPIARYYGGLNTNEEARKILLKNIFDKRNIPLVAMITGLLLNLSGIKRPVVFSTVIDFTVYIGTLISGIAVGLLFSRSNIFRYTKENIISIIYRTTLYPMFFLLCAKLFHLSQLDTFVLILFGITPSAIFSNLIADLFNLDKNLTNSIYIISTALFLIIILPVYLYITTILF